MSNTNKPNIVFWIIGIVALLWNLMGVSSYLMQAFKVESYTSLLNEEQFALTYGLPTWMTAFFAIAVFSGVLGCITLLMRKSIAIKLFIVSFVTATIQQLYWLFGTNAPEVFSEMNPYLMPILVIMVCAFLVWYSRVQKTKGIL